MTRFSSKRQAAASKNKPPDQVACLFADFSTCEQLREILGRAFREPFEAANQSKKTGKPLCTQPSVLNAIQRKSAAITCSTHPRHPASKQALGLMPLATFADATITI